MVYSGGDAFQTSFENWIHRDWVMPQKTRVGKPKRFKPLSRIGFIATHHTKSSWRAILSFKPLSRIGCVATLPKNVVATMLITFQTSFENWMRRDGR